VPLIRAEHRRGVNLDHVLTLEMDKYPRGRFLSRVSKPRNASRWPTFGHRPANQKRIKGLMIPSSLVSIM
jgi:hypothetical protein